MEEEENPCLHGKCILVEEDGREKKAKNKLCRELKDEYFEEKARNITVRVGRTTTV